MALTRKFLAAMGIESEKIDEIIANHAETIDALKDERDKYKADADKLAGVQAELDALKAAGDGDTYKDRFEKIKKDFDDFKAQTAAEKELETKKAAFTEVCKDAGLSEKGVAKALKYADWEKVTLDDSGKVKDAKDHIKSLREEWAEHVVSEQTHGADTAKPPASTGGSYKTKEEIYAIKDAAARQQAILENHQLFGI